MGLFGGKGSIILALVLGLLAAAAAYQYLKKQGVKPPPPIPMAQVVVAAQEIPSRTVVTAAMLTEKKVASEAKHPNALTSVAEAVGKVTRYPITTDEQVLARKFSTDRQDSGLSFVIPPSKRAVALPVREV